LIPYIRQYSIRFLLFAFIAILFICPSVLALDYMGPPVTEQDPGQFRVGFDYSSGSVDLNIINGTYKRYLEGVLSSTGDPVDFIIEDFATTNLYIDIGYGIDYTWEIFVKMGGSSAEFDQDLLGKGFDSGYIPGIGGGIKLSLYEDYDFRLGALAQINWAHYSGKLTEPTAHSTAEVDLKEIQIAAGATYMLTEEFWIYGGPFFYMVMGDFDYIFDTLFDDSINEPQAQTTEYSWDIEEDSSFGGYFGAQWILSKDSAINAEYQFSSSSSAFGVSLVLRY
jgi:hypothetical protein